MNQDERVQAELLDRYITARQAGRDASLPVGIQISDIALLEEMLALAESAHPSAESVAKTADSLRAIAQRRARTDSARPRHATTARQPLLDTIARSLNMNKRILLPLAGLAAVILLAILILPQLNRPTTPEAGGVAEAPTTTAEAVVPTQPPAGETQVAPATTAPAEAPSPTQPPDIETPVPTTPVPLPTAVPVLPLLADWMSGGYGGQGAASPADLEFILDAALPTAPAQMTAYLQRNPAPLSGESLAQLAAHLGLDGAQLYESGAVAWPDELFFESAGALRYTNWSVLPSNGTWFYPPHEAPSTDGALAAAQLFLAEHGLLDYPFQMEVDGNTVRVFELLDGTWLVRGSTADVYVRADGQVGLVDFRRPERDTIGEYPVISAEEAWAVVTAGEPAGQLWYSAYPAASLNPNVWLRPYAADERADVFAPLQVRRTVDTDQSPLITAGNLPVAGDPSQLQALAEAHQALVAQTGDVESPLHFWGTVREAGGYLALQLEGWDVPFSVDPMAGLLDPAGAPYQWSGVVQRQGEGAQLLTDEFQPVLSGLSFQLPDMPADLADGTAVYVQGGLVGETVEWSRIQVRPGDEAMVPPPAPQAAVVNQVELIYLAPQTSLMAQTAAPEELRVLMPVWSFSGQLDNGSRFQVWVQAVSSEYIRQAG